MPGFSDTPPWIAAHAEWLQDNAIADGFDDGTFKPNNNITRGQTAYWLGNYNNSLELVENEVSNTTPGIGALVGLVFCPEGKRAIAGGADHAFTGFYIYNSHPRDPLPTTGEGWEIGWRHPTGGTFGTATIYALCAPETLPG